MEQPPRRGYKWELLALLCCAFFFHQGDRAIFGVVLPAIKSDLQLTDGEVGMVGSVLFFVLAIMMPVAGYIGDVFRRKWIITFSLLFWSAATLITGLARGVMGLVLFRSVATAGGESFYAPAAYPLLATFHKETRAFAMSVHQAALYIGVITSGFLGGFIAQHWGWRSAFFTYGGLGILLAVVFVFRLKDGSPTGAAVTTSKPERISPVAALGILFRKPSALLLTVGFTAIVFVNNAYVVWAPAFIGEKFGLSLTTAGGYSMLYHHAAALVGVLVGGRLSDALVMKRPDFRLRLQTAAMLLGAPAILLLGLTGSAAMTYLAMAVFGWFRGLYEANTHASLFDVIPPKFRASAVGVMVMLAFLVGSTSPLMMGKFREIFGAHGLSHGFAVLSGAYVIGGVAVLAALLFTFRRDRVIEEAS